MLRQIKVRPVVNTLDFLKADGKIVLNVVRVLCVMRKFVVMVPAQVAFRNAVFEVERPAVAPPTLERFVVRTGFAKIFHFHLLELAGAENKVFEDDFVAKGLADLRHAERNFHAVRLDDAFKVDKNALTRFRTQINNRGVACDRSEVRLKHKVELADGGV